MAACTINDRLPAIHLCDCIRFSCAGTPRDKTWHEGHVGCQCGDQGNDQRHLDREELSPGGKHLQILRRVESTVLSGQCTARFYSFAGVPRAECGWRHLCGHPGLCRRVECGE